MGVWCCPVPSQLTFWSNKGRLVLPSAQSTHLLVKQGVFGAAQCPVDGAGGLGWRHAATVGGWGGGWVVEVILRVCCLLQEAGSRRQLRQVGVGPCSDQPPFFLFFFFLFFSGDVRLILCFDQRVSSLHVTLSLLFLLA